MVKWGHYRGHTSSLVYIDETSLTCQQQNWTHGSHDNIKNRACAVHRNHGLPRGSDPLPPGSTALPLRRLGGGHHHPNRLPIIIRAPSAHK